MYPGREYTTRSAAVLLVCKAQCCWSSTFSWQPRNGRFLQIILQQRSTDFSLLLKYKYNIAAACREVGEETNVSSVCIQYSKNLQWTVWFIRYDTTLNWIWIYCGLLYAKKIKTIFNYYKKQSLKDFFKYNNKRFCISCRWIVVKPFSSWYYMAWGIVVSLEITRWISSGDKTT